MSSKEEILESMAVMGYEKDSVEAAWQHCAVRTVEGLIDWIDAHAGGVPAETAAAASNANVDAYVTKEWVEQLVAQGSSLVAAQKAVLLSGNKSLEAAADWLREHKGDADLEEPVAVEERRQFSEEEAAFRARQLQEQIRQKIREEEERGRLESEKLRVKMGKEGSDARRAQEELRKQQELELYLRDKQRDEREKEEILRKLEEDKRLRFGDKYVPASVVKGKSPQAQLVETYNKMYSIHRMGQLRELHTCLTTLHSIITRIVDNPLNAQFRSINASNPNFCQRVKDVVGGAHILSLMGFEEKDGYYVAEQPDMDLLREFQETLKQKTDYLATQF